MHEPLPWFPSAPVATNVTISANHACVAANAWRLNYINFEFSNVCFDSQLAVVKMCKLSATTDLSEFTLLANEGRRLLGCIVEVLSALVPTKLERLFGNHNKP